MYLPDSRDWWEKRRGLYNLALVIAGLIAFVCYVIVVDRGISIGTMPCAEITLFTTAFQGMGYVFMMGVANLCYFAGPLSESLVRPQNVSGYRRLMFQVGLWFSVILPFAIPAIVAWSYLVHPSMTVPRDNC